MKETFTLVATAAAGLEAVVGRELRELGYDTQVENGKVRFQGDVRAIAETNIWLRAADRIKIVVGEFPARTFEELFQGVFNVNHLRMLHRFDQKNFHSTQPPFTIAQSASCIFCCPPHAISSNASSVPQRLQIWMSALRLSACC